MEALPKVDVTSYVPLREQATQILRDAIVDGVLEPGEHLVEATICRELATSRSPVREAIRRLEAEGFVEVWPHQGAFVTAVEAGDLSDLFSARAAMEQLATRLTTQMISDDQLAELEELCHKMEAAMHAKDLPLVSYLNTSFHDSIVQLCKNRWLISIAHMLNAHVRRIYRWTIESPERIPHSIQEHFKVLEAIRRRDPEAAEQAMREHLEQAMLAALSRKGEG